MGYTTSLNWWVYRISAINSIKVAPIWSGCSGRELHGFIIWEHEEMNQMSRKEWRSWMWFMWFGKLHDCSCRTEHLGSLQLNLGTKIVAIFLLSTASRPQRKSESPGSPKSHLRIYLGSMFLDLPMQRLSISKTQVFPNANGGEFP